MLYFFSLGLSITQRPACHVAESHMIYSNGNLHIYFRSFDGPSQKMLWRNELFNISNKIIGAL